MVLDARLGEATVEVRATLESLDKDLDSAKSRITGALQNVGKVVAGIAAAGLATIAGGLAITAKKAWDAGKAYEEANRILITSTGAAGEELESLRQISRNVFRAMPHDIDEVATVVGELNTRLDLSGDVLQGVTEDVLNFARVHRLEAAPAARLVGRLINALDEDAEGAALVMDKLALASQMSGIEVDKLGQYIIDAGPAFEELGFGLDRSIALFASFEKAGARPEEVISSLTLALNRMAREGFEEPAEAFAHLIDEIQEAPDILRATELAVELFGARVGSKVAEDIRAGRFDIEDWAEAISNAGGTMDDVSDRTMTLGDRFQVFKNMAIDSLEPVGTLLLETGTKILERLTPAIEGLLESWDNTIRPMIEHFEVFIDALLDGEDPLLAFRELVSNIFPPEVAEKINEIIEGIQDFIQQAKEVVAPIVEWISQIVDLEDILMALGIALLVFVVPAVLALLKPLLIGVAVVAGLAAVIALLRIAFEAVSGFVKSSVAPVFEKITSFIGGVFTRVVDTLAGVWQNTLQPAFQAVWAFLENHVFPLFRAFGDFLDAVFSLVITALAGLWQNVLQPALQVVWEWIGEKLQPVFEALSSFWSNTFLPAVEKIADFIGNTLVKALEGLGKTLDKVKGWFGGLTDAINNISLPSWLTPGSPTPLELGLKGIGHELRKVSRLALPAFRTQLELINPDPLGLSFERGQTAQETNITYNLDAHYAHQDEMTLIEEVRLLNLLGGVT